MTKKHFLLFVCCLALLAPMLVLAAPACTDAASSSLCNPFTTNPKFPKINNFTQFIAFILGVFGGVAGIAAIVYITFAGFRFMTSQGSEEKVTKAKSAVQWTLSGVVLMLISFVLVQALEQVLKYDITENADRLENPIGLNDFTQLYQRMIESFFGIMALLGILMMVFSGYRYVTSGGNEETTAEAKKTILYAVVGIAIAMLAYVIVHSVGRFFGKE